MKRRSLHLVSIAALAAALAACAQTATAPAATLTAATAAPIAAERVTRGNLVLESIPEIPAEVSERLSAYENVRSHAFLDWTGDGSILITPGLVIPTRSMR